MLKYRRALVEGQTPVDFSSIVVKPTNQAIKRKLKMDIEKARKIIGDAHKKAPELLGRPVIGSAVISLFKTHESITKSLLIDFLEEQKSEADKSSSTKKDCDLAITLLRES